MKNIYKLSFLILICIFLLSASSAIFAYQNPTANAGPDLYVTSGMYNANPSAILQGSGFDSNSANLNFYWTCNGGTLSNPNVPQPLFTAESTVWQSAIYICTLTVTNNYGLSASDSAIIYANYNNNNYNYNVNAQTNDATNNYNSQAVLNGNISSGNAPGIVYAWFQWGTTASYGYESVHRPVQNAGTFDQHIADLLPNTTYHFRAVAQKNNGNIIYGQDMTFNSSGYNIINAGQVAGASSVSTGLTNNFLTDSFLLPLLLIIFSAWFYFSGEIYVFADKLKLKIHSAK
ncbi:MAG: hypothetical protein NTY81_01710 [Candidatus Staskawiczbacteria bacterium]|nr:hypothetical protein [Candidatus Staskawiczbacteria bacterium]